MRCVDETISRIKRNPRMFPVALRNARKAMVRRFPYTIFYEIGEEEIMVLAGQWGTRAMGDVGVESN
ncbi:MAG: hypothetical protein QME81_17265 [bacterium]|nr:hypothetical protein [bacterium]